MNARLWAAGGTSAVALVLAFAGRADASVISAMPDTTLSSSPYSISFGGVASYAFTEADTGGNGPGAAVATGGTGEVSTFFGDITDFEAGSSIDQSGEIYTFAAYPSSTLIPNSAADDFIGLSFTLGDGVHYGYAEVDGAELVSYGYDSTPGASIQTGAVPEPASVGLLAIACLGLGAVRRRRR